MGQQFKDIVSERRVAGEPLSGALLQRYAYRDESLRSQWCKVPQLNALVSDLSWVTALDSFLWVPTWAMRLNVEISTFVTADDVNVRLLLNATTSATLNVDWTSAQLDTLTLDIVSGDPGTMIELEIQNRDAATEDLDITLKNLWWTQI